ncbi:MAG: DUF424 domain-containing protein [Halobacteriales archaeon SW_9_67_25]|jgi:hypothetical protein|nr:MAG: DUF424 domain-containing protein [Halobacteriales archaeon SW_9_67_25]
MTLLLNERETDEGLLVSVCDADVLGETFENGDVSLTVDAAFYDGEAADAEAVVASLARCRVANIVGTRAVELALDHGFVAEENVLDIGETRHAQLLWL